MVSRLIEKIQKTKAPICVGLDPMLSYIPEHVTKKAYDEFGEDVYKRQHLTRETISGRRSADGADTLGGVFRPGENLTLGRRGR